MISNEGKRPIKPQLISKFGNLTLTFWLNFLNFIGGNPLNVEEDYEDVWHPSLNSPYKVF